MKLAKFLVIAAVTSTALIASILVFSPYSETVEGIDTGHFDEQTQIVPDTTTIPGLLDARESLSYNASLKLYDVQPPLKALPSVLGYSIEDSKFLYPDYTSPPCPQVAVENAYTVSSDYVVTIHCPDAKYITGPTSKVLFEDIQKNKYESNNRRTPKVYTGPFKLEPWEDYVLIRCNGAKKYNAFYYQPHFKPDAYRAALEKTEATGKKPLIILMLGLDSITRNHFYRKFKTTTEYFRQLKAEGEWEVLDFYLHNIAAMNTKGNVPPLFGDVNSNDKADLPDRMGERTIWNQLRQNGFMSLVGFDGCPIAASEDLGRAPKIDHPANRLYCDLIAAKEYSYDGLVRERRCIGNELSHYYIFEYAKTFSNLYVDANQWIYVHANAGHERTGQNAESADKDVAKMIKYYIDTYSKSHEVVTYVIGDHGNRYNNFTYDHRGMQEYKLTAFFTLARHSLLDQIPNLALRENTLRLTTKKDIRESVLWLGNWYTGSSFPSKQPFSNLFTDLISTDRTCEDIGVVSWNCATSEAKLLPESAYTNRDRLDAEGKVLYDIIQRASAFAVTTLNELRKGSTGNGVECKSLQLDYFDNVMHVNHDKGKMKRVLQLDLKMKEDDALFRALLFVPGQDYPPVKRDERFKFGSETLSMSLLSYRRLNWNPDDCKTSMSNGFAKPELCVCSK